MSSNNSPSQQRSRQRKYATMTGRALMVLCRFSNRVGATSSQLGVLAEMLNNEISRRIAKGETGEPFLDSCLRAVVGKFEIPIWTEVLDTMQAEHAKEVAEHQAQRAAELAAKAVVPVEPVVAEVKPAKPKKVRMLTDANVDYARELKLKQIVDDPSKPQHKPTKVGSLKDRVAARGK